METTEFIQKENTVDAILNLINLSNNSQTSKEIFLVITNESWWRMYWNPSPQAWLVKSFPNGNEWYMETNVLLSMAKDQLQNTENMIGFQYKFGDALKIYKVA
jgi:hypothetical protein